MGKKFINPVEKARKQAKQKELKKNKKQRVEARNLNLKGKDPHLIIAELERLDQIEFNVDETPKLNQKVIDNKRSKLKQTMYRIIGMYKKEDQSKYNQVKRLEMEYEAKRMQLVKKFEAINSAKQVNLEEIPLPFCVEDNNNASSNNDKSSSMNTEIFLSKSNLREPQKEFLTITGEIMTNLNPPGCPSYCPPSIDELAEDIMINKELETNAEKDLDEFLKEVDQFEKMVSSNIKETVNKQPTSNKTLNKIQPPINLPPPIPPNIISSTSIPNPINPAPFPILLNTIGLLNHPVAKKPNLPIRQITNLNKQTINPYNKNYQQQQQIKKESVSGGGATIEAKPQLRNLSADVIKFLPTSLKIKRQETKTKKIMKPNQGLQSSRKSTIYNLQSTIVHTPNKSSLNQETNKDAAYEEFMKELNGLI